MKVSVSSGQGDYQRPDPGSYPARCVRLIDLGTQTKEWQGEKKFVRQVMVAWELPTELLEEGDYAGQPFLVYKWYTLSLHEKANLRIDLSSWRGRDFNESELDGFELTEILGKPCMINLQETATGRVKVASVSPPPKGMTVPDQMSDTIYLSLDPAEYDESVFQSLSDRVRDTIALSPEWEIAHSKRSLSLEEIKAEVDGTFADDEDIPF